MSGISSSTGIGHPSAKGGKKTGGGRGGSLNPTDVIPVFLDVATAKELLLALSVALGKPANGKKSGKKGGTKGGGGGKTGGGGGKGGGKGGGGKGGGGKL